MRILLHSAWLATGILLTTVGCSSQDGTSDPPTVSIDGSDASGDEAASGATSQRNRLDHLHPVVEIRTSAGNVTVTLDAEHAPLTVDNFLSYVNSGYYQGTVFHQVYDGQLVLGGGYDTKLLEKAARTPIRNEAHNGLKNRRGAIAMARRPDAIDSSTSQFFINLADNPSLDHHGSDPADYGYCVFGQVTSGMEVIEQIAESPVKTAGQFDNVPVNVVAIESVRRLK